MKILSLRASFGRLNNEVLDLKDGLNVITLPNESGKSTWSQFILAMFYGIDTSERAKAGTLPVKTKYKPWSGAPMQGSMDLIWNGRAITLERTSTGRGIMNNFRAYETESGLNIPELTAENCGKTLLGVERSVFERSAFIRQSGITVTQDSVLEQRLQALVTTGDEGASHSEAERVLKDRRNYLGRARTGQLDHLAPELQQVQTQLQELELLGKQVFALNQSQQQLEAEEQSLRQQLALSRAHEAAAKLQQLTAAERRANEAEAQLAEAQRNFDAMPSETVLAELEQQLDTLPQPPSHPGEAPAAPTVPDVFSGMDEPQIREMTDSDLSAMDALPEEQKAPLLLIILSILFSAAGIALVFSHLPLGLASVVIGQLLLQIGLYRRRKISAANQEHARQRQQILEKYAAADRSGIVQLCERCCAELRMHSQQRAQFEAALHSYETAQQTYEAAVQEILRRTCAFCSVSELSEVRPALREVRTQYEQLRRAEQEAVQAKQNYVNLKSALGELIAPDETLLQQTPSRTSAELEQALAVCRQKLMQLRSQLDQLEGRRSVLGDPAELSARQEELSEQCEAIRLHVEALDIALAALSSAGDEVQTRISPAMAQKAGEYLAELTDRRYDRVQLASDFSAHARLTGESVHHELAYLSAGAADQLYLSVRLAICALALEEQYAAPLILDDALAFFDDTRCKKALELLRQLSETRQILLFSCQNREAELLN